MYYENIEIGRSVSLRNYNRLGHNITQQMLVIGKGNDVHINNNGDKYIWVECLVVGSGIKHIIPSNKL